MKHADQWKPGYVHITKKGDVEADWRHVYAGSQHIAQLQVRAVTALLRTHVSGRVLEAGCGLLPYFGVYRDQCDDVLAVDHRPGLPFTDAEVDLCASWPWNAASFDTILVLDVLAHARDPFLLLSEAASALRPGGKLILSTPFNYWISAYPDEYFRFTDTALRGLMENNGLEILHLESYGGRADVLLDTLNKGATGRWQNRLFRLFRWIVLRSRWYRKCNSRTRVTYPLGYTLVAEKRG